MSVFSLSCSLFCLSFCPKHSIFILPVCVIFNLILFFVLSSFFLSPVGLFYLISMFPSIHFFSCRSHLFSSFYLVLSSFLSPMYASFSLPFYYFLSIFYLCQSVSSFFILPFCLLCFPFSCFWCLPIILFSFMSV